MLFLYLAMCLLCCVSVAIKKDFLLSYVQDLHLIWRRQQQRLFCQCRVRAPLLLLGAHTLVSHNMHIYQKAFFCGLWKHQRRKNVNVPQTDPFFLRSDLPARLTASITSPTPTDTAPADIARPRAPRIRLTLSTGITLCSHLRQGRRQFLRRAFLGPPPGSHSSNCARAASI